MSYEKVIRVILLELAGLNLVTIVVRTYQGGSIGTPAYLVILVLMAIGGVWPIKKSNQVSNLENVEKSRYQLYCTG